jgi:hypothetical protein
MRNILMTKKQELEIIKEMRKEIEVENINGRTVIVYNKTKLKGKATPTDVLNVALVAAKMQIEKYIEKLSRGAPLEPSEVKALTELANIAKIPLPEVETLTIAPEESTATVELKDTLYKALTDKLKEKQS